MYQDTLILNICGADQINLVLMQRVTLEVMVVVMVTIPLLEFAPYYCK